MVVGVTGGIAVSHSPFVEISPIVGILIIILTRINRIERHQPLIIYATCPDITGTYTTIKTGDSIIGILFHKVTVHFLHDLQCFLLIGQVLSIYTDSTCQYEKE